MVISVAFKKETSMSPLATLTTFQAGRLYLITSKRAEFLCKQRTTLKHMHSKLSNKAQFALESWHTQIFFVYVHSLEYTFNNCS